MSVNNDELLLNIKRQSKRLSKNLSIPLGHAQETLSIVVYDSGSWGSLITSLKSLSFEKNSLMLTALHPKADLFLFKLLENNMDSIISRYRDRFNDQKNNEEIKDLIISIFGIEPSDFKEKI